MLLLLTKLIFRKRTWFKEFFFQVNKIIQIKIIFLVDMNMEHFLNIQYGIVFL